jgi:hypothetical protein
MCIGMGSRKRIAAPAPVQLPTAPQIVQAPQTLQSAPAPARPIDQLTYKKRGKRALTIPQTTLNIPGS